MNLLLDTHILLWWLEGGARLSEDQRAALTEDRGKPLLLSEISLWEIAILHELKRIRLGLPLRDWLEKASAPPRVERCGITPAIAAEVVSLPSSFHRDPADRIIVATARVRGATVLTRDRRIIDSGLVKVLA